MGIVLRTETELIQKADIIYIKNYRSPIRVYTSLYLIDLMTNLCEHVTDFDLRGEPYFLGVL